MIESRFTSFTKNFVICCHQVTKFFRFGHDCTNTSSARSPCTFRPQADVTISVFREVSIDTTQGCSSSYFKDRCIAIENMCLFVHAVVCCCGCFGVTRHMKQSSRADRLRSVRTLAVRHRFRIVSLGPRQRGGAFTVCFPSWNCILCVCARTPAELVATLPKNQVFPKFVFVRSSPSTCNRHLARSLCFLKLIRALFHSPYLAFSVSLALSWSIGKMSV